MFGSFDWNVLRNGIVTEIMPKLIGYGPNPTLQIQQAEQNGIAQGFYESYHKKVLAYFKGWDLPLNANAIRFLTPGIIEYIRSPDARNWENVNQGEFKARNSSRPATPLDIPRSTTNGETVYLKPKENIIILKRAEEDKIYELYTQLNFGISPYTGLPKETQGIGFTDDHSWYVERDGYYFDATTGEYFGNDVNFLRRTGIKKEEDLITVLNDVEWMDMKNRILSRLSYLRLEEEDRLKALEIALKEEQKVVANRLGWEQIKNRILKTILGVEQLDKEIKDETNRQVFTLKPPTKKTVFRTATGTVLLSPNARKVSGSQQLLTQLTNKTYYKNSFDKIIDPTITELLTPSPVINIPPPLSESSDDLKGKIAELEAMLNAAENTNQSLQSQINSLLTAPQYDPSKFKLTEDQQTILDSLGLYAWEEGFPLTDEQINFYYERIVSIVRGRAFQARIETGNSPEQWAEAIQPELTAFLKGINVVRLGESINVNVLNTNLRPVTDYFIEFLKSDAARNISPDNVSVGQFLTRKPKRKLTQPVPFSQIPLSTPVPSSLSASDLERLLFEMETKSRAIVLADANEVFYTTPNPPTSDRAFNLRYLLQEEKDLLLSYIKSRDEKKSISDDTIKAVNSLLNSIWYIRLSKRGENILKNAISRDEANTVINISPSSNNNVTTSVKVANIRSFIEENQISYTEKFKINYNSVEDIIAVKDLGNFIIRNNILPFQTVRITTLR